MFSLSCLEYADGEWQLVVVYGGSLGFSALANKPTGHIHQTVESKDANKTVF